MGKISEITLRALLPALFLATSLPAQQLQSPLTPDRGKLLLTGGFSDVEGSGGGGLSSWALISGYGSDSSWGANSHYTYVAVDDFRLDSYGVAVGILDRVELSFTRQDFEVTGTALAGVAVSQDVIGAKIRLFGNAVYDQDSWLPQVSFGVQRKSNRGFKNAGALVSVTQLGARDEDGTDYLLSATKLFLRQSVLLSGAVRYTEANQLGLLGFGGDLEDSAEPQFEGTAAYLLRRNLAIGAEFRSKPHNLGVDNEEDAWDVFVAWAPNKHVSVLAAWVRLGEILGLATGETRDQQGPYLSVQAGF